MSRVSSVCDQRQQKEEGAEHILALGNPGYRFDMQRMQPEDEGDERAASDKAGGGAQPEKKQGRVRGVQQKAGEMMAGGSETEEGAIERVRHPSERVPVAGVGGGEGPSDRSPTQSGDYLRVSSYVIEVVVAHESIAQDRRKAEQNYAGKRERKSDAAPE
jgi:hypothetical protein